MSEVVQIGVFFDGTGNDKDSGEFRGNSGDILLNSMVFTASA